jgi:ABC-type bacteriocin/lantibiotic exporter with double-glycine peptidase domain
MAHSSRSPVDRFFTLVRLDGWDIFILFCYASASGILALAVPLAAQALVNTIAQGLLLPPLVILTVAVFLGLVLSGVLKTLQFALVEGVQQRLFARLGLRLSELLPKFDRQEFLRANGPEALNKFFEIVNVQKSWAKLLLDLPASGVEVLLSFVFLALNGPELLLLTGSTLFVTLLLLTLLGSGGLRTSIKESYAKYELADSLAQMGRCQDSLKLSEAGEPFLLRADESIHKYLSYRQSHFYVLLRQLGTFYFLNAVAGATILGLGGYLIMERQLSVGQLVAAEIVVLGLLKACEKIVKSWGAVFDLLTGLDKLGHLLEIPLDPPVSARDLQSEKGCDLHFRSVHYSYVSTGPKLFQGLDFSVRAGERVSIISDEGSGNSTLAQLAVGLLHPDQGQVEVEGQNAYSVSRQRLAWLTDRDELFDTDLEDNIVLGREISPGELRWALELSGLHEHLPSLPKGLQTEVLCCGRNISRTQMIRTLLARTIVSRPCLLVIDQCLYGLDFEKRIETVRRLYSKDMPWTILNMQEETESLALSDRILWLQDGQIKDLGSPQAATADPQFAGRFPNLSKRLKSRLEEGSNV